MARTAPAYCESSDLMLGDLSVPRGMTRDQWISQTADEMDAMIGQLYNLPIEFNEQIPAHKQDILLLKKINSFLASGRMIMAMAIPGEQNSLHAYGNSLVTEARQELARIAAGRTVIEAADLIEATVPDLRTPVITNRDSGSYVDAFYRSAGTGQIAAAGYNAINPIYPIAGT